MPGWLNWIERETSNLEVEGSSPSSGVYLYKNYFIKIIFLQI